MPSTEIITSAPDQYQTMLNNYASILEKTNQQLGLWSNPYGIMIGILTLLITIAAIVVSVILWRNSAEQKKLARDFFENQEKIIREKNERMEKLANERHEEAKKEFESLIVEQQEKLKLADEVGKNEIQKAIDDLRKQKAGIGVLDGMVVSGSGSSVYYPNPSSTFGVPTGVTGVFTDPVTGLSYANANSGVVQGLDGTYISVHNRNCSSCKKNYRQDPFKVNVGNLCDACKKKGIL